jgi:hypothetical protein
MYFFKFNQQDAALYNILYHCQCSTCFRRLFRPSSGAKTVHNSIWYVSGLLAATASVGEVVLVNSPTLVVAASKLDIYQTLCLQFELLMMGGEPA